MSWFATWNSIDPVVAWGISVLLQVTLMAATTLALARCFRRNSAIRYWLCCGGLSLMLLCPFNVLLLQYAGIGLWSVPISAGNAGYELIENDNSIDAPQPASPKAASLEESPASQLARANTPRAAGQDSDGRAAASGMHLDNALPTAADDAAMEGGTAAMSAMSATRSPSSGVAAGTERAQAANLRLSALRVLGAPLLAVWLAGAALKFVRLLVGWRRVARLIDSAAATDDLELLSAFARACRSLGIQPERVQLKTSSTLTIPIAAGCLRPLVILPERLPKQITLQQLHEILVHEAAHIVRRDPIVAVFQNVASALYWLHPLVGWLNRQLAQAREEVCDNYVLATGDATSYSRTLLTIGELAGRSRALPGTVGLFTSRWRLEQRVTGLLDSRRNRMTRLTILGRSLAGLSTLVVGLASLATIKLAVAQTPDRPETTTQQNVAQTEASKNASSQDATRGVAKQETETKFELRVVGPDEAPVPYANIEIRPKADPSRVLDGTFERQAAYGTMVKTTKDGTLVLRLPAKAAPSFSVQMDGFAPYWAEWRNEVLPPKFTIQLDAARAIGGVVVDEDGTPIQGALVRPNIFFKKRAGDTSALGVGTRITTDEAGRWQYTRLPQSMSSFTVEVSHPDFMSIRPSLSAELFDLKTPDQTSAKIVMKRGLSVTGKVTDTQGKPVIGALVRTKFQNDIREARTNEAGQYQLVGCEPSLARIVVSATGLATDMQTVRISEEPMEPVDFVMQPGGHVRIRVIDENHQPIPKTRIFMQRWREGRYEYFELDHAPQYTDKDGVWEWNEAPLDEFQADICRFNGMELGEQPLIARAEEYVFSPPQALVVVGRVVDAETKQPIQNFQVVPGVRSSPEHMNWVPGETFEARNGVFEHRETHDYFAHLFKVQAKGYLPAESREIKSNEGRVEVTFELKRGKDIDLLVAMPDGRPAVGAKIALGIPGAQINVHNGDIDDGSTYAQRAVTGADGRFRFAAQSTPYQLVITHQAGFAHVRSEELEDAKRVDLTPWAKAAGIFRVAGEPVAGVRLYLTSGNVHSYGREAPSIFTSSYVVTGNDGRFALERVFPGEGSVQRDILRVVGEGAKEVTSSTRLALKFYPGETTQVDFEGIGSRVTGRLEVPSGRDQKVIWAFADVNVRTNIALPPLPPPPVRGDEPLDPTNPKVKEWLDLQELHRLAKRAERHYTATVDPTGKFAIEDVVPGSYILSVSFWERQGTGRIDRLEFKVTPEDAENRRELDLGTLQLK